MKISHHIVVLVSLSLVALVGCDQNRSGPVATSPVATGAVEAAPAAAAKGGARASDLFTTAGPAAAVTVGSEQAVQLTIKPTPGFKINKLFQWNFEFHPSDNVQLSTTEVAMSDVQLEDSHAVIPVSLTATAPGEHELVATGDFSICNDDKCELYRDREITFQIAAQAPTDGG